MIRRNARLRKEYLYRKSLEGKEKATYERKRLIRKALDGEAARVLNALNSSLISQHPTAPTPTPTPRLLPSSSLPQQRASPSPQNCARMRPSCGGR